jgi:opacity protein-like surface antigen
MWGGQSTLVTAAVVAALAAGTAARAQSTYIVGGGGFATLSGDSEISDSRGSGWGIEGGLRREVHENILVGISGGVYRSNLDPDEFFGSRDVFLPTPEDQISGGEATIYSVTVEGIYEYPIDRTTILYGKVGGGMYMFSTKTIFTNADVLELDQIPTTIEFEDESNFGGYFGAGVRFPLGESAGLWFEFDVHLTEAAGGSAQIIPLTLGISLP